MRILIIGSGGREHALAWKIAQSKRVTEVVTVPGNGGTKKNAQVDINDSAALADFAHDNGIDLTLVGPEVPLANGVHITVDGKPVAAVPFQVCQRREGCIAYIPLNNEIVSAFKAGNQAVATMKSGVGEALNLPISLSGFTAGFGSIQ